MTSVLEQHGKLQKMSPEVLAQPHYTGFGTLFLKPQEFVEEFLNWNEVIRCPF